MWWWARTGSHQGPIPTSTSSPAPTIHGLGRAIRRIVGASGERMRGVGPCGRPCVHLSLPCLACPCPARLAPALLLSLPYSFYPCPAQAQGNTAILIPSPLATLSSAS